MNESIALHYVYKDTKFFVLCKTGTAGHFVCAYTECLKCSNKRITTVEVTLNNKDIGFICIPCFESLLIMPDEEFYGRIS